MQNYKLSNDTDDRSNQKSNTTLLIAYLSYVHIRTMNDQHDIKI